LPLLHAGTEWNKTQNNWQINPPAHTYTEWSQQMAESPRLTGDGTTPP